MVLRFFSLILLVLTAGCASAGYERYGIFDERRDNIYQHRASFIDDSRISMAYTVVYWEALTVKIEKEERMPEMYYVWLRNNGSVSVVIDPQNLSLFTEKGEQIQLSPKTADTLFPLNRGQLGPYESVGGYVAFDVDRETMEKDKPSRLVYDDNEGNRAVRYLLIEDMKKYEGLLLEPEPRYYAPVYPREYWYPYYYPYAYYPYDLRYYFFYRYEPYRHHYYYIPSKPKERRFRTPPSSGSSEEREFQKPKSGSGKKREFR